MKTKNSLAVVAAIMATPGIVLAQFNERDVTYPDTYGAVLGQGWDTMTERPKPMICVAFTPRQDEYQDKRISSQRVLDDETLSLVTDLNARAKVKSKAVGTGGEANHSTHIEAHNKLITSEVNVVVTAETRNGRRYVGPMDDAPISLSDKASALLNGQGTATERLAAFHAHCGDSFVSSIEDGARAHAVYSFRSSTKDERQKITHDTGGSGTFLGMGGGGGVSFMFERTRNQKIEHTTITFDQEGGSGGNLPVSMRSEDGEGISDSELLAIISKLPSEAAPGGDEEKGSVSGGAKPMILSLLSYRSLPNLPDEFVQPRDPTYEELVARYYLRLQSIYNTVLSMYRDQPYITAGRQDNWYYSWQIELALKKNPARIGDARDYLGHRLSMVARLLRELEDRPECYDPSLKKVHINGFSARCEGTDGGTAFYTDELNMDPYIEYVDLPVPKNAFRQEEWDSYIADGNKVDLPLSYVEMRYAYWIIEIDKIRCEIMNECLTREQKRYYYEQILGTNSKVTKSLMNEIMTHNSSAGLVSIQGDETTILPFQTVEFSDQPLTRISGSDATNLVLNLMGSEDDPNVEVFAITSTTRNQSAVATLLEQPQLQQSKFKNRIFVGKYDLLEIDWIATGWRDSRFYVERYPVVNGKAGAKDPDWRRSFGFNEPMRDRGPRARDYVYEITFEVQYCEGAWVRFGEYAKTYGPSGCPTEGHETTVKREYSHSDSRMKVYGEIARHESVIEAKTTFLGDRP